MKEIRSLTGLRGLVAIWVMAYHYDIIDPALRKYTFVSRGYIGVDFFFILSGFVLAGAYSGFLRDNSFPNYIKYLVARAGRIFPLHLVVTIACVAAAWIADSPYSHYQVVEESLLIHRWPFVPAIFSAINGPAWSISTEWLVNLFLPAYFYLILKPKRAVMPMLALTLALLVLVFISWQNNWNLDQSRANTNGPILRCASEFCLGVLIFRYRSLAKLFSCRSREIFLVALIVLVIFQISLSKVDTLIVISIALFIMIIQTGDSMFAHFLESRLVYALGEWSYSVYLIHLPLIRAVAYLIHRGSVSFLHPKIAVSASLFLIMCLSYVCFKYIEVPARRVSRKYKSS